MFVKPLIVANWKMNCSLLEASRLISAVREHILSNRLISTCVICPPFTLLRDMADNMPGTPLRLGGQNCFYAQEGAYTGEVSPAMLRDMGCSFVILGHSERRMYFAETGETVQKKAIAAQQAGLTPVICVGETLFERQNGITKDILAQQLESSLPRNASPAGVVVAYEPVWAIGSGKIPELMEINDAHAFIKEHIGGMRDISGAVGDTPVLYGGSVNAKNAADILHLPHVDGALAGRASIDADEFIALLRIADIEADNKILVAN